MKSEIEIYIDEKTAMVKQRLAEIPLNATSQQYMDRTFWLGYRAALEDLKKQIGGKNERDSS